MRDCDNCARCGRNGCTAWDCDFIPRKEAVKAWKEKRDIVRCEECRYWPGNDIGDIDEWEECRWREDEATDADDFCSYGERNE